MGLDPEGKSWGKRHPVIVTFLVIILIVIAGTGLKLLQKKYFPAKEVEFKEPVFINQSFKEVDSLFSVESNLTEEDQDELFEQKYKYNVFRWTCRPISCQQIMGAPTLKLVCKEYGFTEDVRIAMKEDCTEAAKQPEVTVVFQLLSKTTGEYYLGRSGKIVG